MTAHTLRSTALAGLLLLAAAGASAATFTNVPNGADNGLPFAYFGNGTSDAPAAGEVFTLASGATLSSFAFYALGNETRALQLTVAQWNPGTNAKNQDVNTVGSNLLATTHFAVETYDSTRGITTLAFDDLALGLTAGTKYVAYLTSADAAVTGIQLSRTQTTADASGFGIGNAYLSTIPGNGWLLPFGGSGFLSLQYTATTSAVPEPAACALLLAGLGLMRIVARRRRI